MSVLVALTDSHQKTLTPEGPVKITAGARPTVVAKGTAEQSMVIRDEDHSNWGPGTYRLVVSCGGTGTLVAFISVGASAQIKVLGPCGPEVTTDSVQVDAATPASQNVIVITPVGDTRAAVAYQVVKV